ncbi:prefoldin subunit 6-like [Convolutriloba macropyga]|uniref:prefoldin subunit 6-like n=1 Tax=Convolutriloba macropyga TaxID=536237 RepID=UPI003F51E67F
MQTIQERIQKESEFYAKNQKEMQKLLENRQKLDAQINDNKLVKEVLDELEPENKVYKMIGPVLVLQDLEESQLNVNKRLDYMNGEIKRHDQRIKSIQEDQEKHKDRIVKLQEDLQKAQTKAALKK